MARGAGRRARGRVGRAECEELKAALGEAHVQLRVWKRGAETGFHPATISRRLREGPPPARRVAADGARVMSGRWAERIEALVGEHPRLLGHQRVALPGSGGLRGELCDGDDGVAPHTRASFRCRGPGVGADLHRARPRRPSSDWCDLDGVARRWGWGARLVCFGMILCWSRRRIWWFATSEDRNHTFEGAVRFFEAVGGVPAVCRTDRMGALGSSQGSRFVLWPAAVGFAAHHSTRIAACRAGDAKRKGKVERPFRQLRETFPPRVGGSGSAGVAGGTEPARRGVARRACARR